ncbi:MAG: MarR family transcriptional regulator [Thermoflavifilum sp.]|nr:MarR family transcriptional regulator [Thermoflavifilum sp.]MCL6513774.1 MarR family transcriptional regulator [Alicyclobacillus sp.]
MPAWEEDALGVIERELALLIRRAESTKSDETQSDTLERAAYLILTWLDERGPTSIRELADVLAVDISTVSRQVAGLESKGLVHRQTDPADARVSVLSITEVGRERLMGTRAARRALYARVLAEWTAEDQAAFARLLRRFNQAVARDRQRRG